MSDTSVQTAPATASPGAGPEVNVGKPPSPRPIPVSVPMRVLRLLASLRLTVVLFVLSIILVFYGTLAQIDGGIFSIVNSYFRCFIAWIPLQLNLQFAQVFLGVPRNWTIPGVIPFPGGYILGGLMLFNLLAAHLLRFKLSWKRSGILLIHAGMILLLLGELVTAVWAVEGIMIIEEGESASYINHFHNIELAVVEPNVTEDDKAVDEMTVLPASLLRPGRPIENEKLPFRVETLRYMANSDLRQPDSEKENPATAGFGKEQVAVELKEVSGVSTKQEGEYPSVYVQLTDKKGQDLGTWLFSTLLRSQPVTVEGKTYQVGLRFKRSYKPYSLQLLEFRFDRFIGTNKPRNFSSKVVLTDPERNENREVLIRMNEPLRYRGETFYQAGWNEKTEKGTRLQVVRNPGWLLPYVSCTVLTLGLLVHFSITLAGFLQRRGIL